MFNKITSVAAACLALTFAGGAQAAAVTFDAVNDTESLLFQTTWDGASLSTQVDFKLISWTAGSATFAMHVVNSSSGPNQNAFMSFGIDVVTPGLTAASATGIWGAGLDTTLPSFGHVDLCVYAAAGCPGGAVFSGIAEGATSDFSLTLSTDGDFTAAGITFTSPYGAKYQSVGVSGESYEFAGCFLSTAGCGGGGETSVPEPATLALVSLALLGIGAASRRRA